MFFTVFHYVYHLIELMLTNLLFASLFAINIGLIVYLSINEKMHAQPWRLLALAFISLIMTFWFQTSIDSLAATLDALKPNERHLEDIKLSLSLVNTVVGSFSGALIGTAVTNRAMHLNSKKLKELKTREERCKATFLQAEEIKLELADVTNTLNHEEFMKKHKLRERLLAEYIDELHEIRDEEEELSL